MGRQVWRARVDEIIAPRVWLRGTGKVALRVRGFALGWVRCNQQRRWTWGSFDEVFWIAPAVGAQIVVRGLAELVAREVRFAPLHRFSLPRAERVSALPPRLRSSAFPTPRVRVGVLRLRVPRTLLPAPPLATSGTRADSFAVSEPVKKAPL